MKNHYSLIILLALLPGCWGKKDPASQPLRTLSYDDLVVATQRHQEAGRTVVVLEALEMMVKKAPGAQEKETALLQLADALLENGQYEKAQASYAEFTKLFPGSTQIARARHDEIRSHFLFCRASYRDQSETRATIALAETYLHDFTADTAYSDGVREILVTCYRTLADNELRIAKFYMHRFETYEQNTAALSAAQSRIAFCTNDIVGRLADLDPHYAPIHQELTVALARTDIPETDTATRLAYLHNLTNLLQRATESITT